MGEYGTIVMSPKILNEVMTLLSCNLETMWMTAGPHYTGLFSM